MMAERSLSLSLLSGLYIHEKNWPSPWQGYTCTPSVWNKLFFHQRDWLLRTLTGKVSCFVFPQWCDSEIELYIIRNWVSISSRKICCKMMDTLERQKDKHKTSPRNHYTYRQFKVLGFSKICKSEWVSEWMSEDFGVNLTTFRSYGKEGVLRACVIYRTFVIRWSFVQCCLSERK